MSEYIDDNLQIVGRSIELRKLIHDLKKTYVYSYRTDAWKAILGAAIDGLAGLEKALIDQAINASQREEATLIRGVDSLPRDS